VIGPSDSEGLFAFNLPPRLAEMPSAVGAGLRRDKVYITYHCAWAAVFSCCFRTRSKNSIATKAKSCQVTTAHLIIMK